MAHYDQIDRRLDVRDAVERALQAIERQEKRSVELLNIPMPRHRSALFWKLSTALVAALLLVLWVSVAYPDVVWLLLEAF